jgi:hypothetical protein
VAMNGNALVGALRPAPGLIRFLGLRLGIVILSSLPALIAGIEGVASGVARRPYYTAVEGKLPLVNLVRLFKDLPGGFLPAAVVGVVLAVLGDQLLLGGAVAIFDPARPPGDKVRVFATVLKDGLSHLWAFLRTIGWSLVLWAIGIGLIRFIFKKLDVMAYHSGWSGHSTVLRLPLLSTFLTLLWIASCGAWAFWCRLITAADGRRRVRRTGLLVLRVFRRHPLRSWGIFTALTLASTLLSGAVLIAWREAEPRTSGRLAGWLLLWLGTLAVQSFVWLWLVRAARLLYASDSLADIRSMPDEPFRLFAKLLWWRRKAPAPPPEPPSAAEQP